MKILKVDDTDIVLRDDLEAEDLICLLDLLEGTRNTSGVEVDVTVGYKFPKAQPAADANKEE